MQKDSECETTVVPKKPRIRTSLYYIAWACVVTGLLFLEVRLSIHRPDDNFLHGTWSGRHKDASVVLILNKDGSCELKVSAAESKEKSVIRGNYSIDFTSEPLPLTITTATGIDCNLHTIVEVGSADVIRIAAFSRTEKMRALTFVDGFDLRRVPEKL